MIIFGGGAEMCFSNFIFSPIAVKKIAFFLDKFYRVERTLKIFFKIFQSFFAELLRFENFDRSFYKKITKVRPPFFFIKRII